MRILSPSQLVSIVEALPDERVAAQDRFNEIAPLLTNCAGLERWTAEGFFQAHIIRLDNVPTYCVWTNITPDRGLHLNVAVQLTQRGDIEKLVSAVETLAEKNNCFYVRFNTKRAGLIARAEAYGYKPDSICMIKQL